MNRNSKFTVVGLGYVGTSVAVLLSQKFQVLAYDIDIKKVQKINRNLSPIPEKKIQYLLNKKKLNLVGTNDEDSAFMNADYVIICVPTNYSNTTGSFNTSIVEKIIDKIIKKNDKAVIIIKSTVPIGFTKNLKLKLKYHDIYFSPEFLREGTALHDNLYPSRVIIGNKSKKSLAFAKVLENLSLNKKTNVMTMSSCEAEAVKLFSNTFLAMRVAFFNELDTYAEIYNLNSKKIIEGVSLDKRIGNYYNNPSFGYGGYCLPKDTRQLLKNFNNVPNNLIKSIISANITRKQFIVKSILETNPKIIGIYKISMKKNSDNFRESAIIDIIKKLSKKNIEIIIYEPNIKSDYYKKYKCYKNFQFFAKKSEIIIANRVDNRLKKFRNKLYTRDIFEEN